jgi:hypothetical protein
MITGKPYVQVAAPPLVDDANAAEIYSDNFVGLVFNQGNIGLTFATTRADHTKAPPTNTRKVALRLVMPTSAVADLHMALGQVLKDLENRGIIKTSPPLQVVQ